MITIIAIGKKHESWISAGIERYEKRLKAPFDVKWVLLPHSNFEGDRARVEESERIRLRLNERSHVILLDERGRQRTSEALSSGLQKLFVDSKEIVLVIGGAFGVDDDLHTRADDVLSLSELVFPHQLVRLLIVEQLYRAQEIARGSGYHHV